MAPFKKSILPLLLAPLFSLMPAMALAWPNDADWIAIYRGVDPVDDTLNDAAGSRDIVGDTTTPYPAAYISNDGTYINFRIRLDDDPLNNPRTALDPFGWGFIIDTDQNADDYEWMVMVDGISEEIYLAENTLKTGTGDPSDKAEVIATPTWPEAAVLNSNYRVVTADSTFNGDTDYFLDFRLNYTDFKAATGITDSTPVRYFMGSSNSAQTLASDLVAASDLYAGLSETVLPTGPQPTTGSAKFAADLAGTGDVTEIYPGDTIYIRVDDADRNSMASEAETITVTISAPSGDSETVTVTETGINTGIFTGSIVSSGAAPTVSDGTLQVEAIETATATYTDAVDAALNENQSRTDTLTVLPSADLELTKTVSNLTPNEGDPISYRLSLINTGPSNSSGVQVYDPLPAGVTYDSYSGDGTYNFSTGIWTVPPTLSGYSSILSINATVDSGTAYSTITNFTNITTAGQLDPISANNSDSASITVAGADLNLTKSVDNATPNTGDTVIFTITVTNEGLNNSSNIEVTDLLPAGLSFVSYSSSTAYNSGTGLWNVGDLTVGASSTLKLAATVTAGSGSLISNTAHITATDQADPHAADNSASISISVGGTDVAVTKTINNATPNEGEGIFYTLTVTNNGNNDATGLAVTDSLPAGVTYLSDSGGGSYNSGSGLWTIGNLANGANTFLNISATIDSGTAGTSISNTASLSAIDQLDPVSGNDSSAASLTVQKADLAITKAVDNSGPNEGDTINYTVTVNNNGPNEATGIEVTDNLPAGVTYVSYSSTQGTYNSGTGLWNITSIANPGTAVLTLTATVDTGTALTSITNTASLSAADQVDPVSSNNTATASISVGGVDLEISKSVNNPVPGEGDAITYTVTIVNNGPNDADGIVIKDMEPAGVSFGTVTVSQGSWNGGQSKWTAGTLVNGASATMTIAATVDAGTTGQTISNTARVTEVDQTDYALANNVSSIDIEVGGLDLAISKTVSNATPTIGDTVTYTITVSNNGPADATGIEVTDNLPSGVTFTSYSATQGSFNNVSGLWTVGGITAAAPNTASLYLRATIDSGTAGWSITNSAHLSAVDQNDSDNSNDSASDLLVVQAADLSIVKTADNSTPDEGDSISYTITVTNNGPHDTTGVEITDLLPAGVTYQSYSSTFGSYSSGPGLWNIGNLAKLSSAVLTIRASVDNGTGGSNITNTASITASGLADTSSANDSSSFVITPRAMPLITLAKLVAAISDPVNGGTNPKAIPGAVMEYTLSATNTGLGVADADTVIITDAIPADTEFYAWDMGGWPVIFSNGATASGLTYTFTSLGDGGDSIEFLDSDDNPMTPTAGFDAAVAKIKITFGGSFNASDGTNHPSFSLKFRVRIK